MVAPRTLRLSALSLVALAVLCLGCVSTATAIYLSPSGAPAWDGKCDTGCGADQPCGLPGTPISAVSAKKTCILNFVGGKYLTPIDIEQGQEATTITASFAANDGGVSGIVLTLKAQDVVVSGNITSGAVSINLEATKTVKLSNVWSDSTSFNFVGAAAPSIATAVTVTTSSVTYTPSDSAVENGIISVFNFDLPAGTSGKRPTFTISQSVVSLTANATGLVYSAGGSAPTTVTLDNTNVTTPNALVTFKETTSTKLTIQDSFVTEASHLFQNLNGVDPTSFNSATAPLTLFLLNSVVTGPSTGFGQAYDPNACINIDLVQASITGFEINCNSPASTNAKDRCSYQLTGATLLDNHICLFNGSSTDNDMLSTEFIVSLPLKAPVMTWVRNIESQLAMGVIFKTIPSASSTSVVAAANEPVSSDVSSAAHLFSGTINFGDLADLEVNGITVDTGAKLKVTTATFSGIIKMRDGASILPVRSGNRYTFDGHTKFVMDGTGSATIDVTDPLELVFIADSSVANVESNTPIVHVDDNVSFLVSGSQYLLAVYTKLAWNSTALGAPGTKPYSLINLASFQYIPTPGARYSINGNSRFTDWLEKSASSNDERKFAIFFGSADKYPPRDAPTPPPVAPTPTSTTPVSTTPVSSTPTAPPTAALCYGLSGQWFNTFSCINGQWYHAGNLEISSTLRIRDTSSPVFVDGNITFTAGGSLMLTGRNAGIRMSGCFNSPDTSVVMLDYTDGWPNVDRWTQGAIIQSATCPADRRNIPFDIAAPRSCKTWVATPGAYMRTGLFINWSLSKSGCTPMLAIGLGVGFGVLALIAVGVGVFVCIRRRRAASEKSQKLGGFTSEYEPLVNN